MQIAVIDLRRDAGHPPQRQRDGGAGQIGRDERQDEAERAGDDERAHDAALRAGDDGQRFAGADPHRDASDAEDALVEPDVTEVGRPLGGDPRGGVQEGLAKRVLLLLLGDRLTVVGHGAAEQSRRRAHRSVARDGGEQQR